MQNRFNVLLNPRFWTPAEREAGRMLRAPDEHPGAPSGFVPDGSQQQSTNGGGDQNNQSVIPDSGATPKNPQDNTGASEFDASKFWVDEPARGETPSPSDSAVSTPAGSSTSNQADQANIGETLIKEIGEAKFEGVFTDEVAKKLAEGDYTAANEAITTNLRSAMRQSLTHQARLLREFGSVITNQVTRQIQDAIGTQVNSDYLVEQIPAASNKKVGPAIRSIYERALDRAGGDRVEAVKQTKAMMATLTQELAGETGFNLAPHDPHAPAAPRKTNWLEELAAR